MLTALKQKNVLYGCLCGICVLVLMFLFMGTHLEEVDPLVGAAWSSAVFRETALGTYRVWQSSDFKGGDIAFVAVKNLEECLFACDENKDCLYVVVVSNQCYLKDSPTRFDVFGNRPNLVAAKRTRSKPLLSSKYHNAETKETTKSRYRFWKGQQFDGKIISSNSEPSFDSCLATCDKSQDCIYVTYDGSNCAILENAQKQFEKQGLSGQAACAVRVRMKEAPDPLVKHHWTKGDTKESLASIYQTWQGCQFVGGDITTVKAKNLDECLSRCDRELFCDRVTLTGQECVLKGLNAESFEIIPERNDIWSAQRVATKQGEEANFFLMVNDANSVGDLHDDKLFGSFYDEGYDVETKFYRYHAWTGFSFVGSNLDAPVKSLTSIDVESCLALCDSTPDCFFVNVIIGNECQLKRRPSDFLRSVDTQSSDVAALKLGRVGKKGIDSKTVLRKDSRQNVDPYLTIRNFWAKGKSEENSGPVSPDKTTNFLVLFGIFVLACFIYYKVDQSKKIYSNEL